jgi:hypothetical protein
LRQNRLKNKIADENPEAEPILDHVFGMFLVKGIFVYLKVFLLRDWITDAQVAKVIVIIVYNQMLFYFTFSC